jgi:VWFA-related protein
MRLWMGRIACLLTVVPSSTPALAIEIQQAQEKQPQFSVRVNLVSLDVEVLNQQGEPVPDLKRSDFAIKEDDKPREISSFAWVTGQPVSLTMILDTSALTTEKLSVAKQYITLLAHLLARDDEICLYTFDYRDAYLEQDFTRDRLDLVTALENVGVTSGKKRTFFKDQFGHEPRAALSVDLALLNSSKGKNERKALLVVSNRHKGLGKATIDHANEAGCAIFILSLSGSAAALPALETDSSDKGQLARESGGRQFVTEGQDMTRICRSIARSLKNHYTITYLTEIGGRPQGSRKIEVLIPERHFIIHARRSYTVQPPK